MTEPIVYVVEVLASVIMLAFVAYETGGYAGHYRTVINQLLSCLYGAVMLRYPSLHCVYKLVTPLLTAYNIATIMNHSQAAIFCCISQCLFIFHICMVKSPAI